MHLEPNDLIMFARVAEEGSFSGAAARLKMPKSTLSRRLSAMESELGEQLLMRTTRKLSVTDFGRSLLAHAQQVAAEVDAAVALTQHRQMEPSGRLRLSMPGDFVSELLGSMLVQFMSKFPSVSLEMDLSPRRVDLIGENFDLAIRMGDLPDDATLVARRIAVFSMGLYAAPAYLRRHGNPSEPEALMEHEALQLLKRDGEPASWKLSREGGEWEGKPPARTTANAPSILLRLARAGIGIASITDHIAAPFVEKGELLPVL